MKIKCEYCNGYLDDTEEKCPNCGASNEHLKRVGNQVPTTISELEEWYKGHNLPPYDVTRFFIGIDYKNPKAFGIYKDDQTGNYVVYKNKDTGERKIRYEGKDEKYAVNELYLKLKEEIVNQKNLSMNKKNGGFFHKLIHGLLMGILETIIFFLFIFGIVFAITNYCPQRGYYNINNQEYYYVSGNWYIYSPVVGWKSTSKPEYKGRISQYYDGVSYDSDDSYTDIRESSAYDSSWDDSDWDSSSSWDSSDSWDSGGTDWSSDW